MVAPAVLTLYLFKSTANTNAPAQQAADAKVALYGSSEVSCL